MMKRALSRMLAWPTMNILPNIALLHLDVWPRASCNGANGKLIFRL
jgi:hypothetical protein